MDRDSNQRRGLHRSNEQLHLSQAEQQQPPDQLQKFAQHDHLETRNPHNFDIPVSLKNNFFHF